MRPIHAVMAIALVSILSVSVVPSAAGEENVEASFYSGDLEVEVLLNRNNITVNGDILEQMESDGSAKAMDEKYILRGSSNQELFVEIGYWEGDPATEKLPFIDSGHTVTVGIPSTLEYMDVRVSDISMSMHQGTAFTPELRWWFFDRGFHLCEVTGEGTLIFVKEKYSIELSTEKTKIVGMDVLGLSSDLGGIREDVLDLLSLMGEDPMLFDEERISTEDGEMELFVPALSFRDIDWETVVQDELQHLVDQGIVKGLEEDDINSIAESSSPGLSGVSGRILEFRGIAGDDDPMWTSYLNTTFPIPERVEPDDGSISVQDIPGEEEIPSKEVFPYWAIGVMAGAVIVILGTTRGIIKAQAGKLMKNAYRKQILEMIREEPGIHFRELMREIDIKQGVLSYHINRMEKADLIKSRQDGMYRRFYPYNSKVDIKLSLSDLQKDIMLHVMNDPGVSKSGVSKSTGRNQALIHYHVRFLKDAGLLWVEKEGNRTRLFATGMGSSVIGI